MVEIMRILKIYLILLCLVFVYPAQISHAKSVSQRLKEDWERRQLEKREGSKNSSSKDKKKRKSNKFKNPLKKEKYKKVGRFRLFDDKLSADEFTQFLEGVEYMDRFYAKMGASVKRLNMRMFTDKDRYDEYYNKNFRGSKKHIANAYYSSRKNEMVVYKHWNFMRSFYHEYSHAFYRDIIPKGAPRWLNEGLAEYFEGMKFHSRSRVTISPQRGRLLTVRGWKGRLPNYVEDIMTLSFRNFKAKYDDSNYNAYTISWAIAYFILKQTRGEHIMEKFLKGIARGRTSKEAIGAAYPGGYSSFIEDFSAFY